MAIFKNSIYWDMPPFTIDSKQRPAPTFRVEEKANPSTGKMSAASIY
jgi:hypothetical protein